MTANSVHPLRFGYRRKGSTCRRSAFCPKAGQMKTSAYIDLNLVREWGKGDLLLEALLGLFSLLAFRHDCGAKSRPQIVGEFIKLGVAINLNGLLGGIAYYVAVVAPSQVIFELGLRPVIEGAVQIICQLLQELRAFHFWPSPLSRFLK